MDIDGWSAVGGFIFLHSSVSWGMIRSVSAGELLRPFTSLGTRSDCGAALLQPRASAGRLSDSSLCTSEFNCG